MRLRLALGTVLFLAAALRFTGLSWGLQHTPHVDERYFVDNVAVMLSEGDLDYRFYEYPGLFFYLLYPVLAVVDSDIPAGPGAYLAARGVVAAFGVASVALVYLLGMRLAGPTTGLVAALFLAVSPVEVHTAHSVRPDVVLETFVLLAFLVFRSVGETRRQDVFSGMALGAATAVKFSGILLVPSYIVYRLLAPGPRLGRMFLAGGLSLLTFLVLSPYTLLNVRGFMDGVFTQFDYHYVDRSEAATDYLGMLWIYLGHPEGTLRKALGSLGMLLMLVGVFPASREWRKWIPLLLFPVVVVVAFSTAEVHHDRFLVPTLGVLTLLVGRAAAHLYQRQAPATIALTLLALAFPFYSSLSYVRDISRPSTRDQALDWMEANLAPGARVLSPLTDVGGQRIQFEILKASSSPARFRLQSTNTDLLLLRPADEERYAVELPLTAAIEPESIYSGPPLRLYAIPDRFRSQYQRIPLELSWASASEGRERIPKLIDGRLSSYWETESDQRPGNWIQVRFPTPMTVGRIELSSGDRPLRSARRLRLEGLTEDKVWREIPYVMGRPGLKRQVLDDEGPSQVLVLEPTVVRGLRLFQTGRRTKPWSIAELRVDAVRQP